MQDDARARTGAGAPSGDPFVGRVLDGRYRVGARIARGGMASVYDGTDLRLDRTVAIKIMHAGLGDDDAFAARFVREARAAAGLSHPNVVAVYDQGQDESIDGALFIVMELVSGHTLRDTVTKESPMPALRALALMEPVLSALGSAHRAGLIHRDIKPENVLIADDGRVKVADFGLAKAVSSETQHTTKGVLIGSVSYLAPELVVEGRADARADVYAAGVVLFELLTGTKPHEGETPIQVAYKHVHNDVPPPSSLVPDLPAYVDALVARATSREPGLRPADASVLLHQVHRVSHALADGVRDDPELTQDLAPMLMAGGGTSPDIWDDAEMAEILEPEPSVREHTSTYPRALPPPAGPPEEPAPDGAPPAALAPRAGAAGAGPGAGAARRSAVPTGSAGLATPTTPGVLGMAQSEAEAKLEDAGLKVEYDDPAYSETVPEGSVLTTDPSPGSRVLDNGTVNVTVSLGKERYDVPRLKGMTEDEAQDALLEVKLVYDETVPRYSEKVPEGQVIGTDPKAGTTLKPGASVDLIVSRGPPAAQGRRLGRQGRRQGDLGAEGARAGAEGRQGGAQRHRGRGQRDQPEPQRRHAVQGRRGVVHGVAGARADRGAVGPRLRGRGRHRGARGASASTSTSTRRSPTRWASCSGTDPDAGELAPKGSTITLIIV